MPPIKFDTFYLSGNAAPLNFIVRVIIKQDLKHRASQKIIENSPSIKKRNIEKRSFFENGRGVRLGVGPPHTLHSLTFSSFSPTLISFSTHDLSSPNKKNGGKTAPTKDDEIVIALFIFSQFLLKSNNLPLINLDKNASLIIFG